MLKKTTNLMTNSCIDHISVEKDDESNARGSYPPLRNASHGPHVLGEKTEELVRVALHNHKHARKSSNGQLTIEIRRIHKNTKA